MLDDVRRCSAMYGDVDDVYRQNYVCRCLAMSCDTRTTISVKSRWPMFGSVLRCLQAYAIAWRCLSTFHDFGGASHCLATRSHVWRRLATCVDISRAHCCRPSFWIYLEQGAGSTPVLARGDVC